ncbi:MAG TPA: glycosyltransferase family 2 protein [Actinomycetota bacterium]|nr:glycosyltransferase family 2 protein [Actinomycetota bacterium]
MDRTESFDHVRTPSVLVVLVVRNGLPWLRECLQALGAQTHTRLGILAVDNGSTDGSIELLEQALGSARVLRRSGEHGLAGALKEALELPVAGAADYLLILHDDTALAPDAVAKMVEAAEGIGGVERVGVVGPKVVDWDRPRILREVGRSTDRFGHPYTPLQDGELDQGQYDRVLEVLYVSSCAMLVGREAWQRTGAFDERLGGHHDDMDFCWRARIAGYRVLMTPLAQARHRGAGARGERPHPLERQRSPQYFAERAALASMLKNYGVLSLAWLLPVHVVVGFLRLAYLALARRFEDAYELLSAWVWNLVHLPSTIRRRIRAQSVRAVRDRSVRRFMESAFFRVPRWFQRAERILEEQIEEEREQPSFRARAASLASQHPALVAWTIAALLAAVAYRQLVGPFALSGGALARFPGAPGDFFHELVSGVRTTGLGGSQAASPALAALGAVSEVLFASTALAQKTLLVLLPPAAGYFLYRGLVRQTGQPVAAVLAASSYVMCALMFWAFSEGRLPFLVALAVLPLVADRLEGAFGRELRARPLRFGVGLGAALALGISFLPGIVPGALLLLAVQVLAGRRRGRGLLISLVAAGTAAALVYPLLPAIASSPGEAFASHIGTLSLGLLARLAPAPGPGTWPAAWFLPVAALIAFSVVGAEHRARAWRAVLAAVAGLFLAWASSAGYVPAPLSDAPAYLIVAAASEAAVVAYGLATIGSGIERQAFGYRQIAAAALASVLALGLTGQALVAAYGNWAIGPNGQPSAWPVISQTPGAFRVLWIGRPNGARFPAPGGDPQGLIEAGPASVRYALTGHDGITALDLGRTAEGPGYDYAREVLDELLAGDTSHAGALLAPLGVRYVVAQAGDLPRAAAARLREQLDMDLVPAGGLVIYENARALPLAFTTTSAPFRRAAAGTALAPIAQIPTPEVRTLRPTADGFDASGGGFGFVGWQDEGGWRVESSVGRAGTVRAFGWAIGFDAGSGGAKLVFGGQRVRTLEMWALALLWAAVLWVTRRPVSR